MMSNKWTDEEISILKQNNHLPMDKLLELLDRSKSAIYNKRHALKKQQSQSTSRSQHKAPWTEDEETYLANHYLKLSDAEIGTQLGRSASAVRSRRVKLGLSKRNTNPWTTKELAFVRNNHQHYTNEELGQQIGRSKSVVLSMKQKLGVTQNQKQWTDEDEQFLSNNLQLTDTELADKLNTTVASIDNKRRRLGLVKSDRWSSEEIEFIKDNFHLNDQQLAKHLDRTRKAVQHKRMTLDLYRMEQSSHEVNEDFFKTWTPQMAYILGFVYGDGYIKDQISEYRLIFEITDYKLLRKIADIMGYTSPLTEVPRRKPHYKRQFKLTINRKTMVKDLIKIGVEQAKSNTMELPEIPNQYFYHFLRGYFDADGHVNNRSGLYILFVSASEKFIKQLQVALDQREIPTSLYYRDTKWNGVYQLYIKKKGRRKFVTRLYENSTIHLQRKKDIFNQYYNIPSKKSNHCHTKNQHTDHNHHKCETCQQKQNPDNDNPHKKQNQQLHQHGTLQQSSE